MSTPAASSVQFLLVSVPSTHRKCTLAERGWAAGRGWAAERGARGRA